jgi:hypothetical protein
VKVQGVKGAADVFSSFSHTTVAAARSKEIRHALCVVYRASSTTLLTPADALAMKEGIAPIEETDDARTAPGDLLV